MQLGLSDLLDLVRESIGNPRGVAQRLFALDPPLEARWLAFLSVIVLSVLLAELALVMVAAPTGGVLGGMVGAPFRALALQAAVLVTLSWGLAQGGRLFGGQGRFADALLVVTWVEFVLLCLQVVQLVVMIVFPISSILIGVAGLVLFFWLLAQMTAELHGFASPVRVFFGILGGFFAAALILAVAMSVLGLGPAVTGGSGNV